MIPSVAIIGGGLSGTLVVLHLLKLQKEPLHITWFDQNNAFAKGLAYSTPHNWHLLNVPASNMSLYPDEPSHFTDWLKAANHTYQAHDFVPRRLYGEYALEQLHTLQAQNPHITLQMVPHAVISIRKNGETYQLKADATYTASQVVYAPGNFAPAHPRSPDTAYQQSKRYFQDSFDAACLPAALQAKELLVLGSGLTMLDLVLSLHHLQYKGQITIISPHGYLPQSHQTKRVQPVEEFIDRTSRYSPADILRLVNTQLKQAKEQGLDPLSIIDRLRPHIQWCWTRFSPEEKQQFLRHLRHKWGVARHRATPESLDILNHMAKTGQLRIIRGRIRSIQCHEQGFQVDHASGPGTINQLQADCVVNCTGPGSDYKVIEHPLVKDLLAKGYIAADAIHYGLQATEEGLLMPGFYTLGPSLKGVLWESTAIPEIRIQARHLALKIIGD